MNIHDFAHTMHALAAITMILIGSSWLKGWLKSLLA